MADTSSIRKDDVSHDEVLRDQDVAKEENLYLGVLTPEEKVIEKKLRRKIDILIMPLVVLV